MMRAPFEGAVFVSAVGFVLWIAPSLQSSRSQGRRTSESESSQGLSLVLGLMLLTLTLSALSGVITVAELLWSLKGPAR